MAGHCPRGAAGLARWLCRGQLALSLSLMAPVSPSLSQPAASQGSPAIPGGHLRKAQG